MGGASRRSAAVGGASQELEGAVGGVRGGSQVPWARLAGRSDAVGGACWEEQEAAVGGASPATWAEQGAAVGGASGRSGSTLWAGLPGGRWVPWAGRSRRKRRQLWAGLVGWSGALGRRAGFWSFPVAGEARGRSRTERHGPAAARRQ